MNVSDFEGIARFALVNGISLVVVGPEVPLAEGITDYLQQQGLMVFGPTRLAAQIEASKAWAKALMQEAKIPTAKSAVFTQAEPAIAYVRKEGAPIVVKADGLAAGKGVTVAATVAEAEAAIADVFNGKFGDAGSRVVIEECLVGEEASILALTDGLTIRPLLPAQDHKRIGEDDTGPNTGGMGAYAPAPIVTPQLMERIQTEILEPAIAVMRKREIDYRGILYAGLMITPEGTPKVIEFNCRFGDPETQVVLPLLETSLDELLLACVQQRLADLPPITWKTGTAACVVMAAGGYPDAYEKGKVITGIDQAEIGGAVVFHAGTQLKPDSKQPLKQPSPPSTLVSDGGRVLGVTALGENFNNAIANTYDAVRCIQFDGMYYRRDIGHRVLATQSISVAQD
jgi:phosphoribosylamine--glycine ligase